MRLLLITHGMSIVHIAESLHGFFAVKFIAGFTHGLRYIAFCLRNGLPVASQLCKLTLPVRDDGRNDGATVLDDSSGFLHVCPGNILLPLLMRKDREVFIDDLPRMAVDLVFGMIATERLLDIKQIRPQIPLDSIAMQFTKPLEE